jgi:hypothetical protein
VEIIEFHDPVLVDAYPKGWRDDRDVAAELAARVQDVIQAGLYCNLERRGSVFA